MRVSALGIIVTGLASGAALVATDSQCNSDPPGETDNPEFQFSGYCKALRLHPYSNHATNGALLDGIFVLPVIVALCGATAAICLSRRAPVRWALRVSAALAVVLFVVAIGLAGHQFHGV